MLMLVHLKELKSVLGIVSRTKLKRRCVMEWCGHSARVENDKLHPFPAKA